MMPPRWMRAVAVGVLAFVAGCATYAPVAPPADPPPVVEPPQPPPPDIPPPVVPPDAPVPISELVARLAVGSTVAETEEVMGRAPDLVVPASGPAPETRRWYVAESGSKWAIYVVMRGGKVSSVGSSKIVEVP